MFLDEFDLREIKRIAGVCGLKKLCDSKTIISNVAGIKYLESLGI
jgi:hypothetical protein